jgi:hypothetical protein
MAFPLSEKYYTNEDTPYPCIMDNRLQQNQNGRIINEEEKISSDQTVIGDQINNINNRIDNKISNNEIEKNIQINNNNNNNNNNEGIILVSTSVIVKKNNYPPYSMSLAIIAFLVNIFFPGFGTIIGSCGINDPEIQSNFCCHGICELFLSFIIIGWCLALCNSCFFLSAASSGKSFEDYYNEQRSKIL